MTEKIKIAALGDLHVRENSHGLYRELFTEISSNADILVLCGDLTDNGLEKEAAVLAEELSFCKIPVAGVLGNHDHESDQVQNVRKILSPRMFVLDPDSYEFNNIGFAGVKGFGGGFDKHVVGPFGEKAIKDFVDQSIHESTRLERQLAELTTKVKVVVMHYSPIRDTVIGESPEIYPFLGSSRLADPLDRFANEVKLVLHGHAHFGSPAGVTITGIPVHNVAYPLMKKLFEEGKLPQPYFLQTIS